MKRFTSPYQNHIKCEDRHNHTLFFLLILMVICTGVLEQLVVNGMLANHRISIRLNKEKEVSVVQVQNSC